VFDEKRVFAAGPVPEPLSFRGTRIGVPVCEDIWTPAITAHLARAGAELLLVPNGSPFETGKFSTRLELVKSRARETNLPVVYVNQVGGQDELVFDGGSMVVSPDGDIVAHAAMFEEDLLLVDLDGHTATAEPRDPWPAGPAEVYGALVLGLGDYVRKNGFREVVLGLSGGVDSALVATLAADALGAGAVRALAMPSPYSSAASVDDAEECARRLGIRLDQIRIDPAFDAYRSALRDVFAGTAEGVAEENLQARIRGTLLMALSNRFGSMVLATGNKSEYAVGYATLYGDMAGGLAPIEDVPKTLVYELVRWRNAQGPGDGPIPAAIVDKPPSAELRANQRDTDSLPPYDVLDPIIEAYVEDDLSVDDIVAAGADRSTVERIASMIDRAEYKRRQAAPGVKITPKAFGRDRRLPITNRYGRS
jgi:NAD+ synthase